MSQGNPWRKMTHVKRVSACLPYAMS